MSDFVVSLVRTTVPVLVGSAIGWLITLGIALPEHATDSLTAGIVALSIALYYAGARWLEIRWPAFGYLLGTRAEPTYAPAAAPEVVATAVGPSGWADLGTLAAALDEGDPARRALAELGVEPAYTPRHAASSVDPD